MSKTIKNNRLLTLLLSMAMVFAFMLLLGGIDKASANEGAMPEVTGFSFEPGDISNLKTIPENCSPNAYYPEDELANAKVTITFDNEQTKEYTYQHKNPQDPGYEGGGLNKGWNYYDGEGNLCPYVVRLLWCDSEGSIEPVNKPMPGNTYYFTAVLKNNESSEILMHDNNWNEYQVTLSDFKNGTTINGITYKAYTEEYNPFSEHRNEASVYKANPYDDNWNDDAEILKEVEINEKKYPVTFIDTDAFKSCETMTSITIPESVTSIGNNAFESCFALSNVNIPNSVTKIGNCAFFDCPILESVKLPSSLTKINASTFSECIKLSDITIPATVTSIGNDAFFNCDSLKNITLPDSVTSIGKYAFENCDELASIKIPNSVTYMGRYAFSYCGNLSSAILPNALPKIRAGMFSGCGKLSRITIPDSVTLIGDSAFYDCSSLQNVKMPNKATLIDEYAFAGCSHLTKISIPSSVTKIDYKAFFDTGIKEVKIPATVKEIGKKAFGYKYDEQLDDDVLVPGYIIDAKANTEGAHYATINRIKLVDREKEAKEKAAALTKAITKAKNAKVTIKAKAMKKGKVTVIWTKASGVTKYQVFRSYKKPKNFVKVGTTNTGKWKGKKLKKGKKYFFKVRTVTKINGTLYYGKWSNVVKVKGKK